MEIELVCLYRCKMCDSRLFERDMHGHLERHGIYANGSTRDYFVRGRRNTPGRPGGNWKPLYQRQALRA